MQTSPTRKGTGTGRLVLTRKRSERICVTHAGETLWIDAAAVGNKIKVGFVGPRSFVVVREEVIRAA